MANEAKMSNAIRTLTQKCIGCLLEYARRRVLSGVFIRFYSCE